MIRVVLPGSRIRMLTLSTRPGSRIPDPGVKKAPDPGSGSATLLSKKNLLKKITTILFQLTQIFF